MHVCCRGLSDRIVFSVRPRRVIIIVSLRHHIACSFVHIRTCRRRASRQRRGCAGSRPRTTARPPTTSGWRPRRPPRAASAAGRCSSACCSQRTRAQSPSSSEARCVMHVLYDAPSRHHRHVIIIMSSSSASAAVSHHQTQYTQSFSRSVSLSSVFCLCPEPVLTKLFGCVRGRRFALRSRWWIRRTHRPISIWTVRR